MDILSRFQEGSCRPSLGTRIKIESSLLMQIQPRYVAVKKINDKTLLVTMILWQCCVVHLMMKQIVFLIWLIR